MNPEFHDEFVALSAVYYSGEISEEEWALLQIHMAYCDSCHENFLQYQRVTSDVIPIMAAIAASEHDYVSRESEESVKDAERKLMGRHSSPSFQEEVPRPPKFGWRLPSKMIAACGLGAACLLGVYFVRTKVHFGTKAVQVAQIPVPVNRPRSVPPDRDGQQAFEHSNRRVAILEQQVAAADNQLKVTSSALADIKKQLEVEQATRKQLSEDKNALSQRLAAAQTELDSNRNKLAAAGTDNAQQSARSVALETQVRELKATLDEEDVALSEKDRMLAVDKDFLAHDRDIRDLIGARNLYIADIFDTKENGKTSKQFGRIFYTKDRSLVFYGFDLDSQAGHKQNVSFQVWGSGSDRPTPLSLGLFYQDDAHKRWVLRCNDAKSLAYLDMVFVTVEPPGGSPRPTGKQLLRAYLQIHPNHP
jgi:anti-sigma-K factor RskA